MNTYDLDSVLHSPHYQFNSYKKLYEVGIIIIIIVIIIIRWENGDRKRLSNFFLTFGYWRTNLNCNIKVQQYAASWKRSLFSHPFQPFLYWIQPPIKKESLTKRFQPLPCMSKEYQSGQPVTTLHLQSAGGPICKVPREAGTMYVAVNYWVFYVSGIVLSAFLYICMP